MTDQEGGKIRRLSGAPLLSAKQIGESADPATEATQAGSGAGRNLRGVGMNVNLAPVLDVYRKAGDFDDQYGRSYSMSPSVVSELGADFIASQQRVGVAATAKALPRPGRSLGLAEHRRATGDLEGVVATHCARSTSPPTTRRSPPESGWSWCPGPCTRRSTRASRRGCRPSSCGGELRQRLGFKGVTISDALECRRAAGIRDARASRRAGGRGRHRSHRLRGTSRRRGREGQGRPGAWLRERQSEQVGLPGIASTDRRPSLGPRRLTCSAVCARRPVTPSIGSSQSLSAACAGTKPGAGQH